MTFDNILILAIIQGVTEFLPISSSGHLLLASTCLNIPNNIIFNLALHLGTVCALIIYFRKDIYHLIKASLLFAVGKNKNLYYIPQIIISTIPAALVGTLAIFCNVSYVYDILLLFAINSIIFGILLYLADYYSKSRISFYNINKKQALLIGLAQGLSVIPGVSRLGICMTAARFTKIDKVSSVKYSMLISIPIILGGVIVKILPQVNNPDFLYLEFLLGINLSCLVGLGVIKLLLTWVSKYTFKIFMLYRICLGMIILLYLYVF